MRLLFTDDHKCKGGSVCAELNMGDFRNNHISMPGYVTTEITMEVFGETYEDAKSEFYKAWKQYLKKLQSALGFHSVTIKPLPELFFDGTGKEITKEAFVKRNLDALAEFKRYY